MAGRLLAGLTRIQLLRTITEQKEGRAPSHRSIHLSELQLLGLNGCLQLVCLTG